MDYVISASYGHSIEEVTPAEMQRRYDALFA